MTTPATLTLSGFGELIASIPTALGFHPTDSAVVCCLTGRVLGPVMRIDLPDRESGHGAGAHSATRQIRAIGRYLATQAIRHGDRVAVAVFSDDPHALAWARTLGRQMAAAGLPVMGTAVVDAGGTKELTLPNGPVCTLPEPDDSVLSELRAHGVLAGRRVLTDRDELRASVAAPTGEQERAATQRLAAAVASLDPNAARLAIWTVFCRAVRQTRRAGGVGPDTAAELCALAADVEHRDTLIAELVRDGGQGAAGRVPALVSALAQLPAAGSEHLCSALVAAAYRAGDGALAQVAADRCLRTDPHHRLTRLLVDIMAAGLPPSSLDELSADLDRRRRDGQ